MEVCHSEAEPINFSSLAWISLQFCLQDCHCSQVLYYGKYVLSILNNQGNKKLAPTGVRDLVTALLMHTRCLHIALDLSLVDRSKGYIRAYVVLGPPSLPL